MGSYLEEYRKQKEISDSIAHRPECTLVEYIESKNPKTLKDVQDIIDFWFLPDEADILQCYVEKEHNGNWSQQYGGVKIREKGRNGKKMYYPPDSIIEVPRGILLKNTAFTIIKKKTRT